MEIGARQDRLGRRRCQVGPGPGALREMSVPGLWLDVSGPIPVRRGPRTLSPLLGVT